MQGAEDDTRDPDTPANLNVDQHLLHLDLAVAKIPSPRADHHHNIDIDQIPTPLNAAPARRDAPFDEGGAELHAVRPARLGGYGIFRALQTNF